MDVFFSKHVDFVADSLRLKLERELVRSPAPLWMDHKTMESWENEMPEILLLFINFNNLILS